MYKANANCLRRDGAVRGSSRRRAEEGRGVIDAEYVDVDDRK